MEEATRAVDIVATHDHLLKAIGDVVVSFQQIELWISEALAKDLGLKVLEERYLVLSAMSFRQKVDLLMELFPRKRMHMRGVDMALVRKAFRAAEEYRNTIVHSVWAVDGDRGWTRNKGSLRKKSGFSVVSETAQVEALEAAAAALRTVRDWEIAEAQQLEDAIRVLSFGDDWSGT
ncbi:MAG TPA: hypothetical protein VFF81_02145 [Noviherbaspirillum sp.]|nr:hypothetical protein [Noviherbaspirillum sp.]